MAGVFRWAWAELRARWVASVALAVVAGVAAGAVMAAVAGARRTDTVVERFLDYTRPGHASLGIDVEDDPLAVDASAVDPVFDRIAALDMVEATDRGTYWVMVIADEAGRPDLDAIGTVNPFGAYPGATGEPMTRPLIVEGRHARPDQTFEVVVSELLAARRDVGPGDQLRMFAYGVDQLATLEDFGAGPPTPTGPEVRLEVVGIGRLPMDLAADLGDQDAVFLGAENVFLTPAFAARYDGTIANFGVGMDVRLHDGPAAVDELRRIVERESVGDLPVYAEAGSQQTETAAKVDRAVGLQALALFIFAALATVTGGFIVVQALGRQMRSEAITRGIASALGMTRRGLAGAAAVRGALIGVTAGAIGCGVAVALSPLLPFGLAGEAEIDPGVDVDTTVLALGFLATVVALACTATVAGRRSVLSSDPAEGARRSLSWGAALPAGVSSPSAVTGIQMAFDPGRGEGAVPVRSAVAGTLVAVAGLVASLVFASSLTRLVDDPAEQGWNWDVAVGEFGDEGRSHYEEAVPVARQSSVIGDFSAYIEAGVVVAGHEVPVAAVEPLRGTVFPRMLRGREPLRPEEVALGSATMEALDLSIGETLTLSDEDDGPQPRYRVVGEALFPAGLISLPGSDSTLGDGVVLSIEGFERLRPDIREEVMGFLVRYRPGVDPAAAFASLQDDFGRTVVRPIAPTDVANLRRVRGLPTVLALLLVVLGVGALAHALITSVRRRRRDLAVLKTLGMHRRQVSAVVGWQATTLAVVALVVAVPAGAALGRWAWRLVASEVSAASPPVMEWWVIAVIPAALLVANAVAAVPGWLAGRVRPAVALRSQ